MTREERQRAREHIARKRNSGKETELDREHIAALDLLDRTERILDGDFATEVCPTCPACDVVNGCASKDGDDRAHDVCRVSAIRALLARGK